MAKPKKEDTDDAGGVDLDALDAKLSAWSDKIGESIDGKLAALHKDVTDQLSELRTDVTDQVGDLERRTRGAMSELAEHVDADLPSHDDDDGDVDEDDPETWAEVKEARRMLGRDCPDDVGEIAKSLRERGQRLRLNGLRYATAGDMAKGRTTARPVVRRDAGAVRMSGEANKVHDHKGDLVAAGRRGRARRGN